MISDWKLSIWCIYIILLCFKSGLLWQIQISGIRVFEDLALAYIFFVPNGKKEYTYAK